MNMRAFIVAQIFPIDAHVHVDHVIPWSFLLTDPPWDLVLACKPCNLAKSDVLPRRDYLAKLVLVHDRRALIAQLPVSGFSPIYLPETELFYRYYDAAISVEWLDRLRHHPASRL